VRLAGTGVADMGRRDDPSRRKGLVVMVGACLISGLLPMSSWAGTNGETPLPGPVPTVTPVPVPTPLPDPTPTPTPLPTPEINLTAPSAYPNTGGTGGVRLVNGSEFLIVASVDHPYRLKGGVEIEVVGTIGALALGKAKQVGRGQVFEKLWKIDESPLPNGTTGPAPDGDYTVRARAQVKGSASLVVQTEEKIRLTRTAPGLPSTASAPQWVQLHAPDNGGAAGFTPDITRDISVSGVASPEPKASSSTTAGCPTAVR
jgi:hypothetical protein